MPRPAHLFVFMLCLGWSSLAVAQSPPAQTPPVQERLPPIREFAPIVPPSLEFALEVPTDWSALSDDELVQADRRLDLAQTALGWTGRDKGWALATMLLGGVVGASGLVMMLASLEGPLEYIQAAPVIMVSGGVIFLAGVVWLIERSIADSRSPLTASFTRIRSARNRLRRCQQHRAGDYGWGRGYRPMPGCGYEPPEPAEGATSHFDIGGGPSGFRASLAGTF